MGLFNNDRKTNKQASSGPSQSDRNFISKSIRKELREHAREYLEKALSDNVAHFKRDLHATVDEINTELKAHVTKQVDVTIDNINTELRKHITKQLDDQLVEYKKAMKGAQDVALQSVIRSAQVVREQHERLSETLQKDIADQKLIFAETFRENKLKMAKMKETEDAALETITNTAKALEKQQEQLTNGVQKNIDKQKAVLAKALDENMAQIIEHYLLDALGNQYGLKAQLPSIIKQMEANKQVIMDDIQL